MEPSVFGRAVGRVTPLVRPFVIFLGCSLFLLTTSRALLLIVFRERLGSWGELPLLFLTGLRFDLLLLCYVLAPAWILACLLPRPPRAGSPRWLRVYLSSALALLAVAEVAAWPSLREFGSRPEAHFWEFLGHPREVAGMLVSGFTAELLLAAVLGSVVLWWARRRFVAPAGAVGPTFAWRLGALPVGAVLLFIGARSSFGHRAANLSTAAFSQSQFHNEAALNSTYTLLYAGYQRKNEADVARAYGDLDPKRVLEVVQQESGISPESFRPTAMAPTWHRQEPRLVGAQRPPNVVVILLESLGAEYTGWLGGTSLTPNLDRWAEDGLVFEQLFATGTRTARGLEAVVSGFFPSPARSILKLPLARHGFFAAPALFRAAGYSTHFIYGGEANFDEMKSFFVGNGAEHIWDQPRLQKPEHAVGVWGIHDEDLFAEADAIFRAQREQPFFAVILSTSNHTPFDYPRDRVAPDPHYPVASAENAIKYTDHALGRFLETARSGAYFENTLFLIVADHGTRVSGDQLIPIHKFHVPALVVGPARLVPKERIRCRASQVDLMPTLLGLTGRAWEHPMLGRDLLRQPATQRHDPSAGRALLQYENSFGYWVQDHLVILRPKLAAVQFTVAKVERSGPGAYRFAPEALTPALAEAALAHSLAPGWLYRNRLYPATPVDAVSAAPGPEGQAGATLRANAAARSSIRSGLDK